MRLICPNCGAQYEIDMALLPEAGRDVQCSACGHTWFQRPDTLADDLADELGTAGDEAVEVPPKPRPTRPLSTRGATAEEDAAPPEAQPEPEPEAEHEPSVAAAPPREPRPRPRRPDDAALAILREEAEREAEVRRREAAGMEMQGDLGLDEGTRTRRPSLDSDIELAETVAATVTPEPVVPQPPSPSDGRSGAADSRRGVFPDIDEINSSLTGGDGLTESPIVREAAIAETRSRRRGFRIGFLTVVIFAAGLIALYAYAPRLAESFPQARPYLADYVDWANVKREQVDGMMQSALSLIGG